MLGFQQTFTGIVSSGVAIEKFSHLVQTLEWNIIFKVVEQIKCKKIMEQ